MRKITVSMFVSLDGVVETPELWTPPYWSEDIASFKQTELRAHDALLLGRNTYESFAGMLHDQRDESHYAERLNALPKYVVSTTLQNPLWNPACVIRKDVRREIRRLKAQAGQDILVFGSAALVQTLVQAELVDRFHLLVYPVVLINGIRLFQHGSHARLNLLESELLEKGVVKLVYAPKFDD